MMDELKEALLSFQSITGADEATARCFLESANWNVEVQPSLSSLPQQQTAAATPLSSP